MHPIFMPAQGGGDPHRTTVGGGHAPDRWIAVGGEGGGIAGMARSYRATDEKYSAAAGRLLIPHPGTRSAPR